MGIRSRINVLLALGLAVGSSLAAGSSIAQEPTSSEPQEAPSSAQPEPPPLDAQGQLTLYPVADTFVMQGYPTSNQGGWTLMYGGHDNYWNFKIVRGLVKFNLSGLPPGQRITQAKLRLNLQYSYDPLGTARGIEVYRVNSAWSETGVTWNNQPSYGGSYYMRSVPYLGWGWHEFDVTALARAWVDGVRPNYGFLARGPETSGSAWRGFGTRESSYRPQLVITYGQAKRVYLPVVRRVQGTSGGEVASKVVRTSQEGLLVHPAGAQIYVPRGAVPKNQSGGEGEMLFTIQQGTPQFFGLPSTPPSGWRFVSDVFSMGPEGFIFQTPIRATIPLPRGFDRTHDEAAMFDYDRQNRRWETIGGVINGDGVSVSVDSAHLCGNILMARAITGHGPGAIKFKTLPRYSFKLCIESYTLKYPDWDYGFEVRNRFRSIDRSDVSTTPPDGFQYWILPQGTYLISVAVYYHAQDNIPPTYLGYYQRSITIDRPHWNWQTGGPDFEYPVYFGDFKTTGLMAGRPPCMGSVTPSVGVGSVSVRLNWSANADLDLWVVDPCGYRIWYNSRSAVCQSSRGTLDLDNKCQDMVIGRPENIYWGSNAPRGTYKVYVDYWENCGGAGPVSYTVQWWVDGKAYSQRGTIAPPATRGANGDEVFVTQFSR